MTNGLIRILIIDDNPGDAELIMREVKKAGFSVNWIRVESEIEMREALKRSEWDLILSDYSMPGFGGEQALDLCKSLNLDIPFVLISGTVGEEIAVSFMKKGAADYLMKDKLARLGSVIKRELEDAQIRRERNLALESLRENSMVMKQAQRLASLGSWQWDIRSNKVTWSDELYAIYGLSPDTFNATFEGYLQLVHEEDRDRVEKQILKALTTKTSIQFEERIIRPNGEHRYLRSWGAVLLAENGQPIKMYGACLDITENRKMFEALRWSEQRFKALVANISDIISLLDIQGKILYESASIKQILGYDEDEIVGKYVWEFVHPEDLENVASIFKTKMTEFGGNAQVEFRFRHKDGHYVHMEAQGNSQLDNPAIKGVVVNSRDISHRKLVEAQLKAKNSQLEKTNEEIDRFVYSTSHDLRAPLLSVLGLIEMCEEFYPEDADLHALYAMMRTSIQRSDVIIKSIIDYSRNARLDIVPEQLHLKEMAENFIENIKFMEQAKGIAFSAVGNEDVPFYSDKLRVFTILNNLLTNAVKYQRADEEFKSVRFSFNVTPLHAVLEVSDNGEGIPEDKKDSIFGMFYRLSTQSIGSGLGLYICREMVDRLNGSIELDTSVGRGSSFKVTIPNLLNPIE